MDARRLGRDNMEDPSPFAARDKYPNENKPEEKKEEKKEVKK